SHARSCRPCSRRCPRGLEADPRRRAKAVRRRAKHVEESPSPGRHVRCPQPAAVLAWFAAVGRWRCRSAGSRRGKGAVSRRSTNHHILPSHMFRNLIPELADRYHVIAPDYPGFGQSDMPDRATFSYTFDRFGELVDGLLDALGVKRYAMYVMDYGAPVGWRLALKHPERITALIVQNGNAYEEGLKEFWDPIKAYWSDHSQEHRKALHVLVAPETTKFQYTDGVADVSRVDPDNWVHDQALLDRPGNAEIQMDLFYDYRTNLPLY